eukprot:364991-Chlamydomonas_euryale.AAC.21
MVYNLIRPQCAGAFWLCCTTGWMLLLHLSMHSQTPSMHNLMERWMGLGNGRMYDGARAVVYSTKQNSKAVQRPRAITYHLVGPQSADLLCVCCLYSCNPCPFTAVARSLQERTYYGQITNAASVLEQMLHLTPLVVKQYNPSLVAALGGSSGALACSLAAPWFLERVSSKRYRSHRHRRTIWLRGLRSARPRSPLSAFVAK